MTDQMAERGEKSANRPWKLTTDEKKKFGAIIFGLEVVANIAAFVGPYTRDGLHSLIISMLVASAAGGLVMLYFLLRRSKRLGAFVTWPVLVLAAIGLLAVLVLNGTLGAHLAKNPEAGPPPRGTILSPANDATVGDTISAQGTIENRVKGDQLVGLVYYDGCFSETDTTATDNAWEVDQASIRDIVGVGQNFVFSIAEVDPSGMVALQESATDCDAEDLTSSDGTRILASVDLTRQQTVTPKPPHTSPPAAQQSSSGGDGFWSFVTTPLVFIFSGES